MGIGEEMERWALGKRRCLWRVELVEVGIGKELLVKRVERWGIGSV